MHRHNWKHDRRGLGASPNGTVRTCATCETRQIKIKGRWTVTS